jgi:acyl dehydratase
MAMVEQVPFGELGKLVGKTFTSPWRLVSQGDVNLFAQATGDFQWIHVDVERAKRESPFGGTIAHGYFSLALAQLPRCSDVCSST